MNSSLWCDAIVGQCRVFAAESGVFILQPSTGATLLVSDEVWKHIAAKGWVPELLQALESRGFSGRGLAALAVERDPIPLFFMVDMTRVCSNRCDYCFRPLHTDAHIDARQLSQIIEYIVGYCRKYNHRQISFQAWGGEPLLEWKQIKAAQDELLRAGLDVRMLIETNGVSVTPAIAREMYERGILCSVSIDGPQHVHDRNRHLTGGGGSHERAVRGLKLLQDAGYGNRVGAVCVVTRPSLPDVGQIVDYFASELGLPRVKMNVVKDSPELEDKRLCVTDRELAPFWTALLDALIAVNGRGISFGENTLLGLLHNLTTQRPVSFCHSRGCQGASRMLSFDMEGGIYPCDRVDSPELRLGGVATSPDVAAMLGCQRGTHPFLSLELPPVCGECDWRRFCGGGCRSMRLQQGRQEPDAADCQRNRILYPQLIELILNKPEVVASMSAGEITVV